MPSRNVRDNYDSYSFCLPKLNKLIATNPHCVKLLFSFLQPAGRALIHLHKNLHLQQCLLEKMTKALRPLMLLPGSDVEYAAICLDSITNPNTVGHHFTKAPIVKILMGEMAGADPPRLGSGEDRMGIQSGGFFSILHHHR